MVVPKGDRDVREYVDINGASISTVKELLHDFNGVTVVSKIDLNRGFLSDSTQRGQWTHHYSRHTSRSLSDVGCDVGTRKISANCRRWVE